LPAEPGPQAILAPGDPGTPRSRCVQVPGDHLWRHGQSPCPPNRAPRHPANPAPADPGTARAVQGRPCPPRADPGRADVDVAPPAGGTYLNRRHLPIPERRGPAKAAVP